jgi:adenylate cyclase
VDREHEGDGSDAVADIAPARFVPMPASGSAQARSTVRGVLALQLAANGVGLAVVLAYVGLLMGRPDGEDGRLNLVVFGAYLAVQIALLVPINLVLLSRAVAWVREGVQPTAVQRRLVLRLPLLETIPALVAWIGAAVIFGAINDGTRSATGIGIAGLVTCAVLYLLLEGHFRPVFALALRGVPLPLGRRDVLPRIVLAWLIGSAAPLAAIGAGPLLDDRFQPSRLPWIAGFGLLGGGLVTLSAAVSVARPLGRVRRALRDVEQGRLDIELPVDDVGELGRLAEGVNDLVAGLRDREQLRDLLGRQLGSTEVTEMARDGGVHEDGELREVTVLFADLQGYTRYSEEHRPEEVVALLNRFFQVVVAVVDREGGWVHKFEGDAAMCVFGAPQRDRGHAAAALRAAQELPRELALVDGLLPVGLGVASGEVLAGFIGTVERFEYTVIGDCVNLAARLCDLAKVERHPVLVDSTTVELAGTADEWVAAGRYRIRGRSQRVAAFTVQGGRARWSTLTRRSRADQAGSRSNVR